MFSGAQFYTSAASADQFPHVAGYHEIAFVGRSNAGKSRAINVLVGQKKMAFMSKKPGKTRLINFFEVPRDRLFLVDLPGYGYAAVSRDIKKDWDELMTTYLYDDRPGLRGVVLLSDARHPLHDTDLSFLMWFQATGKPVHLVLTKADQLNRSQQMILMRKTVPERLREAHLDVASMQLMSSLKRTGVDVLVNTVRQWLGQDSEESC